jgi:PilZ domain-containing protein
MAELSRKSAITDMHNTFSNPKQTPEPKPPRRNPERRAHSRHAFSATTEAIEHKSQTRLRGRCSDISQGGCYVDAMNPFPSGSEVTLRMNNGAKSFESPARVVFSKVGMGMGLAFHDTPMDQLGTLAEWTGLNADGRPLAQQEAETMKEEHSTGNNERQVLNRLISMLIRKNVLTENEGSTLLSGIFR